MKNYKTLWLAIILWGVSVTMFFAPSVFNGKIIAPIDCVECIFRPFADMPIENTHNQYVCDGASQYIPHKWQLRKSLQEDGYMGWNPYAYNGTACPENTMYSPGDWHNLLFAVLPFWTAWDAGIILHFFIAGLGMIVLLRHYKLPVWCLLLGAMSFALYSQFLSCMYYRWLGGIVWTPFLVWALLKYNRYLLNVPAIIFISLAWRGGHLQSCSFVFMLVSLMWISSVWKKEGSWPGIKQFSFITCSYLLTGLIGALLSLDVFVDTLPRMSGCKTLPFSWGVLNVLLTPACLFPNVFGVPQSIDVAKCFGFSLFDVKFGGAIAFVLACIASFNPKAPREAKVLLWGSLAISCSPLYTYLYSRGTVVMALGMAWLAAWQLHDLLKVQLKPIYWKRIIFALVAVVGCWLVLSIVFSVYKENIADLMQKAMLSTAYENGAQQIGRIRWYEVRIERFLSKILVWDWQNLVGVVCLLTGIGLCSKIGSCTNRNNILMFGVVLLSFAELVVFSVSWVSYSKTPDSEYVYRVPEWIKKLRKRISDGSVIVYNPKPDFDFVLNNLLSSYDIRQASGYETVRPSYLTPLNGKKHDPCDFALAGISHVIGDTKWGDFDFAGWNTVMCEDEFKVLENPEYKGRYIIDGEFYIRERKRTPNRIYLSIPANSSEITILESFHKGWKAYLSGREVDIKRTERGGMSVAYPKTKHEEEMLLEFHMPYRSWYYAVMACVFCLLIVVFVKQKTVERKNS